MLYYLVRNYNKNVLKWLTDDDKTGSYDVCQKVGSEWFLVFTITFAKEANERVKMVLTETL